MRFRFRPRAAGLLVLPLLALAGAAPAGPDEPGRFRSVPLSQLTLPCELAALNAEYVAALNYRRGQLSPGAPPARFDAGLLPGTFLHAYEMERLDSIFHARGQPGFAELCGSITNLTPYRGRPRELARYIWTRFHDSPPHDAIQRDTALRFVSVSCLDDFFVVRLSSRPHQPDAARQEQFRRTLAAIRAHTARPPRPPVR